MMNYKNLEKSRASFNMLSLFYHFIHSMLSRTFFPPLFPLTRVNLYDSRKLFIEKTFKFTSEICSLW